MTGAQTPEAMSPKLLKVMQRAKRDPEVRFTSLAHLLDEDALRRAHGRIRKDAAVGVERCTRAK
jgi:RNA-directed DNA polymerase